MGKWLNMTIKKNKYKTLPEQLRIKAGMIEMGEKIAWGSDTELMRKAADKIEMLNKKIEIISLKLQLLDNNYDEINIIE